MAKPQDRLGIFAVPTSHDERLLAEVEVAYQAMFEKPESRWYELRRDVFDHLIESSTIHRVVTDPSALEALTAFVRSVGPRKTWDKASPMQRMELARAHATNATQPSLRAALLEVIAQGGELGLWIETEASLPPTPEPEIEDGGVVDAEDAARRLDAFIAEQDWKDLKRKRLL